MVFSSNIQIYCQNGGKLVILLFFRDCNTVCHPYQKQNWIKSHHKTGQYSLIITTGKLAMACSLYPKFETNMTNYRFYKDLLQISYFFITNGLTFALQEHIVLKCPKRNPIVLAYRIKIHNSNITVWHVLWSNKPYTKILCSFYLFY